MELAMKSFLQPWANLRWGFFVGLALTIFQAVYMAVGAAIFAVSWQIELRQVAQAYTGIVTDISREASNVSGITPEAFQALSLVGTNFSERLNELFFTINWLTLATLYLIGALIAMYLVGWFTRMLVTRFGVTLAFSGLIVR